MKKYDHEKIEKKWQKFWEKKGLYEVKDDSTAKSIPKKFYSLIEFPYPSGDGLHVGHIRSNTAMDIISRKRKAEGYNVLYPIGWDAFGLPTENYAIKTGIQPAVVTKKNTDTFRRQLKSLGFAFDWSREINTTDPQYYKWTQWIFLQFLKHGLAYKKKMAINWCPKDKIGLANEEVVDGKCERCGTPVEQKEKEQWMLAITKYAERLDKDLDTVDFLEKIKVEQRNWIGRSEGAEIEFKITNSELRIMVFTTRADTLFGVTYLVLAPEHELISNFKLGITNYEEIKEYIEKSKNKTEIERGDTRKEKTGIELKGVQVINPANGEEIPVWIADYVLASYGTGAVMAVPSHDERDFAFATKHNLPIKEVVIEQKGDYMTGENVQNRDVVKALIVRDGCVLVEEFGNGSLALVGGGIENNENHVQALKREIAEETGYTDIEVGSFLGSIRLSKLVQNYLGQKDVYVNFHHFVYTVKLLSDNKISEGDVHVKWIKLKDYLQTAKTSNNPELDFLKRIFENKVFTSDGITINSAKFSNLSSNNARNQMTKFVGGEIVTKYKLRDWVFSRQRYWGEPIPVIHCESCGTVPVPEKDLPVVLPKVKNYQPTDTGESPLSVIDSWVNVKCPKCKGNAKRETDTMPNWAGSSWYYLRYSDPKNKKVFTDPKKLKYWAPVDWYNGGMEHTTLHLLYSRFWHKFLYDLKLVPTSEPYQKRTSHGLILAEGGEKMSKSKGNVVSPDGLVKTYGADTLRVYEMFAGPFDQPFMWCTDNMIGSRRFLERVWGIQEFIKDSEPKEVTEALHKVIKKVGEDIEEMSFNTAISAMMIFINTVLGGKIITKKSYENFLKILSPFAPHITEEIWANLKNKKSIYLALWPVYEEKYLVSDTVTIMIQVNGKVRGQIRVSKDITDDEVKKLALSDEKVKPHMVDKEIKKTIIVKGKIINFVV